MYKDRGRAHIWHPPCTGKNTVEPGLPSSYQVRRFAAFPPHPHVVDGVQGAGCSNPRSYRPFLLVGLSEVEDLGQHDDPLSAHLASSEVIVSRRDHDHERALRNDEEVLSAIAQSHEYVQGVA